MDIGEKRERIMALVKKCPFDDLLPDCPAFALRGMSFEEQVRVIEKMDEETVDRIIALHRTCLDKRKLASGRTLPAGR